MTVFTVHQPLPRKTEDVAPPERFAFVRDGFYFWAFLLGPLWMFWNRLWLVLVLYLAGTAAIQAALWALGISSGVKFAVAFLIAILVGCGRWSSPTCTSAPRGEQTSCGAPTCARRCSTGSKRATGS